MIKMRVLIVEDRPESREELRDMLKYYQDIDLVGEYEDTASAWPLIETGKIDGVFLDIKIQTEGERAGLDLALRINNLPRAKQPWVVFTTAYDEWAMEAHRVRPFGYLKKPLKDPELGEVLDLIRQAKKENQPNKRRLIKVRHRLEITGEKSLSTKYVFADEIKYVKTENGVDTVMVKLANGKKLTGISVPLKDWDKRVPELTRIHNSHLVNLSYANGYQQAPFRVDGYDISFACCDDLLAIGRNYLRGIQDYFDGQCE